MYLLLLGLTFHLLGLHIRVMSRNCKSSRFTIENFINKCFCLRMCKFYVFKVVTVNTLSPFMDYFILKYFVICVSTKLKTKAFMSPTSSRMYFLIHCMISRFYCLVFSILIFFISGTAFSLIFSEFCGQVS